MRRAQHYMAWDTTWVWGQNVIVSIYHGKPFWVTATFRASGRWSDVFLGLDAEISRQVNVISIEYPGYGLLQGIEPTEEAGCDLQSPG